MRVFHTRTRGCPNLVRVGAQVEVMFGVQSWRFQLQADRTTVGKSPENDISLAEDPTASRLHAILERFPAGWCVTDLGKPDKSEMWEQVQAA